VLEQVIDDELTRGRLVAVNGRVALVAEAFAPGIIDALRRISTVTGPA
jgi:hypothetical protein